VPGAPLPCHRRRVRNAAHRRRAVCALLQGEELIAEIDERGIPLALAPMEAKLVSELPKYAGSQYEPKWDGFLCLAFRAGDEVEIKAKSGKSLSGFFPEVA
jgi:ATP-dependent DNA ligase